MKISLLYWEFPKIIKTNSNELTIHIPIDIFLSSSSLPTFETTNKFYHLFDQFK